jgi:putative redox protein
MSHLTAHASSVPGTLRQQVAIGDGRHVVWTDEPASLGGDDTAPAPHELLPAAIAACVSTTLLLYAVARGWEIGPVEVDVDYDHRATPRRCLVELRLDPSIPPDRVARLAKVAETCPVRRALEGGIVFEERVTATAI